MIDPDKFKEDDMVELDGCTIVHTTDSAVLVEYEGEQHWLPRSQIADDDELEKGDEDVTVKITKWIAEQKGLE